MTDVLSMGDFIVVIYTAAFEKDPEVIVRVVFRPADPHKISGLWFNK